MPVWNEVICPINKNKVMKKLLLLVAGSIFIAGSFAQKQIRLIPLPENLKK